MPIIKPKCPDNYELIKDKCRCKKTIKKKKPKKTIKKKKKTIKQLKEECKKRKKIYDTTTKK